MRYVTCFCDRLTVEVKYRSKGFTSERTGFWLVKSKNRILIQTMSYFPLVSCTPFLVSALHARWGGMLRDNNNNNNFIIVSIILAYYSTAVY